MFVQGGYLEVQPHAITVLADTAIGAKDLDEKAALEAKKAAEEAMANKTSKEEIAAAEASLSTAMAQWRRSASCATAPDVVRGRGRPQPACSGQARAAVR